MHQTLTYDLAFVAPQRHPRTPPEIVLIFDERYLPEVIERLETMTRRLHDYIASYLKSANTSFEMPSIDLFGNKTRCGFGNCAYWTNEDGKIHFRLQMRPQPWTNYCSLTLFMMTSALGYPFRGEPASNQTQNVALMTVCQYDHAGHSVGGWLSEDIHSWLKAYAKDRVVKLGIIDAAPMHEDVIRAQQATWHALHPTKMQQYASSRHIYGWIRDSGAFSLNCFGDACDLSVYPDSVSEGITEAINLSSHNLDAADQQLTLVAGLAKICQLAREGS